MTELIRTENGWRTPDGRLKIFAARATDDVAVKLTLDGLSRADVADVVLLVRRNHAAATRSF